MKKGTVLLLIAGGVLCGGLALADSKQRSPDYEKMLNDLNAKLEIIAENQKRLETIEENQKTIMQMLRTRRLHS